MHRILLTAFVCLAIVAFSQPSQAQDKPSVKVGVVNIQRVIAEAAEAKEINQRSDAAKKDFQAQAQQKEKELNELRQTIQQTLKVGTPQYEEKRKELILKQVEAKNWAEVTQQEFRRMDMQNAKHFFERLDEAVAEVAGKRGLDLILPDMRQPFPDQVDLTPEQFQRVLSTRNVLFAHPSIDVTTDVVAVWDTHFKEKK